MKKVEVIADKVTVTCYKGSVLIVDDIQAELARALLKPVEENKEKKTRKKSDVK